MIGIMQAENSATFSGAVVISLIAYLMLGIYQSYQYKLSSKREEADIEIGLLEAQRKLTNAQTRQVKAGGMAVSENIGKLPENSGMQRIRWNEVNPENYTWIAQASTAEIVNSYGIDERTARNWRHYAQEAKSESTQ
jgi:hypothetical protein